MNITHLKKTGGARFDNVSTYRVVCDDPASNIILISCFKSSHEVGSRDNEFTHVAKGLLQKHGKECVVKVHHSVNPLYDRELYILQHLKKYKNIVQYVCHFSCMDNKERWMYHIVKTRPITPCQGLGTDNLAFMVMEYIPNGDIIDFFTTMPLLRQLKSFLIQTALVIMELGMKYKVYHGDINSGNILVKHTNPNKEMTYDMEGTLVKVITHGVRPVFIDFGRGGFYDKRAKNRSLIMDDVMIAFIMFSKWIKNDPFTEAVLTIIKKHSYPKKKTSFSELINDIKSI